MQAWCTTQEVDDLVSGSPAPELLQTYADHATSILYILSGRRFPGTTSVATSHEVTDRGYIVLTMWQPVRDVTSVTIDGEAVDFALSPAGTYVTVAREHRGKVADLTLQIGQDPPVAGKRAAAHLAAEMLRGDPAYAASAGATDTRQQFRLTSVTRQGVSYSYESLSSLVENDLTGIYEVDLFLRSVNPAGVRYQPKVVTA